MNSSKGCLFTLIFWSFFVMFGPVLCGFGGYVLYRAYAFHQRGEKIEGEVVEIVEDTEIVDHEEGHAEFRVYCPVVRFIAPGTSQAYEDKTDCEHSKKDLPEVGETVSLIVEKGNPDSVQRGSFQSVMRDRLLGGVLALTLGGGIAFLLPLLYWSGVFDEWMEN